MRAIALVFSVLLVLLARPASADEIAPELLTVELRQKANAELRHLTKDLAADDRRRLVGLYLAFDPSVNDASAMAACDDDGDFVIVLTDGMLRLVDDVAHAASLDEANATHKVEDYAIFLARTQLPGRRLVPPPAGSYSADATGTTHEDRLREALAFVVGRELAHLRAGDLACPHPTATREHGDDVWTAAEQRTAETSARTLYPGRAGERDAEATSRLLKAGRTTAGAEALLSFFARHAAEMPAFPTTYARLHPASATRLATVRGARSVAP